MFRDVIDREFRCDQIEGLCPPRVRRVGYWKRPIKNFSSDHGDMQLASVKGTGYHTVKLISDLVAAASAGDGYLLSAIRVTSASTGYWERPTGILSCAGRAVTVF